MATNDEVIRAMGELKEKAMSNMEKVQAYWKLAIVGVLALAGGSLWYNTRPAVAPAPGASAPPPGYAFNGVGLVPTSPVAAPVAAPAPHMAPMPPTIASPLPAPAAAFTAPVSFIVASTGSSQKTGLSYLNSMPDFRAPGNVSIAYPNGTVAPATFHGKTVTATGLLVKTPSGGTTVTLTSPSMIGSR